jgi:predicted dehydrogenase
MKKIKVGVIGCGYWGPNLVRNFNDSMHTDMHSVCDLVPKKTEDIHIRYPNVKTTNDYRTILENDDIEAVAVATPVSTHFRIVSDSLKAGKHVLVEKPLTANLRQAETLVNLALKKGLVLLVDHIFIYTDAIQRIKEYLSKGMLGDMYYFDSVRINLGLFQHDINVLWDLAPHDLAVMDYLIAEQPVSIVATGSSHTGSGLEDVAYLTLRFRSSFIAHFHVNWMSPVKIRKIIIGGSKKMLVFDDLDPSEKIKIYDKGIQEMQSDKNSLYQRLIQYRIGDMYAPSLDSTEALKRLVGHFADCIRTQKAPLTDGMAGLRVVRILEAADKSLKKGARIKL